MNEDVSSVDSSSTTDSSADPSQATSQPAQQQQQQSQDQNVPFHTHPRWKQLMSERGQDRQTIAQLQRTVQELQRGQMQARSQGGLTDEQRRQYGEAAAALKQVMQQDPELAQMFGLLKQFPQLAQQMTGVGELQQAAARANLQNARAHIADLVSKSGLTFADDDMPHVTALVARAAMSLENGDERYKQGDTTLFDEAFQSILPFLKKFGAGAAAQTAQVKGKVTNLPPANTRGGIPGSASAMPKLDKSKGVEGQREYESGLGQLARKLLGAGGSEAV